MDHLLLPVECEPLNIVVPALVDNESDYDALGFESFPDRRGYVRESEHFLTLRELQQKPSAEAVRFVQAWLYFGYLRECFGDAFKRHDVVRQLPDGSSVIDTLSLEHHLITLRLSLNSTQKRPLAAQLMPWSAYRSRWDGKDSELKRLQDVTAIVEKQCNELDADLDEHVPGWNEILLSIRVLVETIDAYAGPVQFGALPIGQSKRPSSRAIGDRLFQRSGWCEHQFRRICNITPWSSVYYLASLRRVERPGCNHASCACESTCVAYDVNLDNYETRHTEGQCQCEHVLAPVHEMYAILHDGGIPVLKCVSHSDGDLSLSYIRASPRSEYVAISHLWADGSGNPRANSLPKCQIRRVVDSILAVRKARGRKWWQLRYMLRDPVTVHFWHDVYCIPLCIVQNEAKLRDLKELKQIALSRMTATYSWAQYVLIQDDELSLATTNHRSIEIMSRIAISGWNFRYWTLEESCLASKRVYSIGDTTLEHDRLLSDFIPRMLSQDLEDGKALEKSEGCPAFPLRPRDIEAALSEMFLPEIDMYGNREGYVASHRGHKKEIVRARRFDFVEAWNSLCWRSCTDRSDAMKILAEMLGFRRSDCKGLSNRQIMEAILSTLHTIPVAILFAEADRDNNLTQEAARGTAQETSELAFTPISPLGATPLMTLYEEILRATEQGLLLTLDKPPRDATARRDAKARYLLAEMSPPSSTSFTVALRSTDQSLVYWYSIKTTSIFEQAHNIPENSSIFLLIERPDDHDPGFETWHQGCYLIPELRSTTRLVVNYGGPISCTAMQNQSGRVGLEPVYHTARMDGDVSEILIQCNTKDWPKIKPLANLIRLRGYRSSYLIRVGMILLLLGMGGYFALAIGLDSATPASVPWYFVFAFLGVYIAYTVLLLRELLFLERLNPYSSDEAWWWIRWQRALPREFHHVRNPLEKCPLYLLKFVATLGHVVLSPLVQGNGRQKNNFQREEMHALEELDE